MKIKYDPEVDAAYISFKKGPTQVTTLRLSEDVAVDLGPHLEPRRLSTQTQKSPSL